MVEKPHTYLRDWLPASIDRVIVHAESEGNVGEYVSEIKEAGLEAGVALKLETSIDVIVSYVQKVDLVQCMSINHIGVYGQSFDERVLIKIRALRERYPNVTISVDGGVTLETGRKAIEAGATQLVVGSGIFKTEDVVKALLDFKNI
jgi:ribulose-phosphate 3-epimerase